MPINDKQLGPNSKKWNKNPYVIYQGGYNNKIGVECSHTQFKNGGPLNLSPQDHTFYWGWLIFTRYNDEKTHFRKQVYSYLTRFQASIEVNTINNFDLLTIYKPENNGKWKGNKEQIGALNGPKGPWHWPRGDTKQIKSI
jgi:hypothetical protein